MLSRAYYLAGRCSHEEYYGQFVTQATLELVKTHIGIDRIRASLDPHLNDIPLKEWDDLSELARHTVRTRILRDAEAPALPPGQYPWSLSLSICILKEAARRIKQQASQSTSEGKENE